MKEKAAAEQGSETTTNNNNQSIVNDYVLGVGLSRLTLKRRATATSSTTDA
jgi:hypothetical protein